MVDDGRGRGRGRGTGRGNFGNLEYEHSQGNNEPYNMQGLGGRRADRHTDFMADKGRGTIGGHQYADGRWNSAFNSIEALEKEKEDP